MTAGTAAAGAAIQWPGIAAAAPWACSTPAACGLGNLRILEIFCYGGMSQWENFWVSEDPGVGKNWRGPRPGPILVAALALPPATARAGMPCSME